MINDLLQYGLKNQLTLEQIIHLEIIAEKYKNLKDFIRNSREIKEFVEAIQEILKGP
jgi:hypothetical protein